MTAIIQGVLASIGKSKVFAGGVGGVDYALLTNAPTGNSTTSINHPAVGYIGTIKMFMCGTSSNTALYFNGSAGSGFNGTGEGVEFTYTAVGDETSFSLIQANFNSGSTATNTTAANMQLVVNGGVNDGKFLIVGSARGNATAYGHGGACNNLSNSVSTLPGTNVKFGAMRAADSTLYYDDATQYDPDSFASYGSALTTYTIGADSAALVMRYSSSGGSGALGMRYRATSGGSYNDYSQITESSTISGGRVSSPNGFGACLLVFKND
jgi:hypothetical protein